MMFLRKSQNEMILEVGIRIVSIGNFVILVVKRTVSFLAFSAESVL